MFGDETADYSQALDAYYDREARRAIGRTTTSVRTRRRHPWEDWAETWMHYLHMVDLLETASSFSTRLVVPGDDIDEIDEVTNPFESAAGDFDQLVGPVDPADASAQQLEPQLRAG
jgi:hypothetical protein